MAVSQSLSVTEVSGSVNTSANTSKVRILWQSTQSGESWNGYTRTAKYYVSINGGAEKEYTVSYTLPQNATKTIVDTTITVTHKDDGTGSVKVRTWMDTGISVGVVEKSQSLTLTTIPRASTITTAYAITLGNKCKIKFTPLSASFWYKIVFSLGNWNTTTAAFRPGTTSAYTYTGDTIPLDVANQFPKAKSGTMTATLYTFESETAVARIGSTSSETFTVTLPENSLTKPSVTMTLSSETPYEKFASLYLQGRSKIQADFSGSGKYGASIVSYRMKVEAKTYDSPYTSHVLLNPGTVSVVGVVTDSRGFVNTVTEDITVLAYSKPSVIPYSGENSIICRRCLSDGTLDDGGSYLLIKIGRRFSKVISDSGQQNYCKLSYRHKTDAQDIAEYSDPIAILLGSASTDYVSVVIANVVTSNTTAYTIQLIAEDDAGEKDIVTITIPTIFITAHSPEGGHGITFGGFHDPTKVDVFDCKFDAEFHGAVTGSVLGLLGSAGEIPGDGDLNDYRVPGVYAISSTNNAESIANMPPVKIAGLLRVYASTGQDYVTEGTWKYIMQEYRSLVAGTPEYRRRLWTDGTATWFYGPWVSGIDDVMHLAGSATQMIGNIYTENGVETCQFAIRAGSDIHVLNITPSGMVYGKNGTVLWSK
jgi:hypothetical protein